ncbi:MAG: flavin reductase (DIM6/NTAB) family NADH-FMN oxidoreductase RutF [Alphaproteobacteria bacterium]|jgi:flavin reductase (DIM6/NTAB) family NADH-FMN oxidoreductase RutF
MLGFTESSKSVQNIRRTGECVLNLPSSSLAGAVDRIAKTTGNNPVPADKAWLEFVHVADKFGRAGLTPIPSTIVAAPRAQECDVQMEATVEQINPFGATNPALRTKIAAIELRIVAVHVNPAIVNKDDPRRVDPDLWRPLIMSFWEFYGLGEKLAPSKLAALPEELWRPPAT